jgi:cytidylate kinase
MSKNFIVAIDGPAGSGKSTSAKLTAQHLGFLYIDTGAMYRAITYLALKKGIEDTSAIVKLAESTDLVLKYVDGRTEVYADGENLTAHIRSLEINQKVSDISKIEGVRKALVAKQQKMGAEANGVVMEGRDIGTVVFPGADLKIYLTASIEQRSIRRAKEYEQSGTVVSIEEIEKNLLLRDKIDSGREHSPLTKAADAVEIDTSKYTIEEQVNVILDHVKERADKKGITVKI